ncbi:uncharacterized protein DUF4331 [Flavobacteriaceae bacterium MAR_2010_72]|nr:uncharacterized protein DUF4331 [Flavobacteriaceae bacterium MAR_2010_72]TVZ59195.1 uncharacterized protein DUF4331 [Flavobacteriaceae bacterium MAR_2010_105]
MKNFKPILGISLLLVAGLCVIAADHIDAPAVTGGTSDITDFYAFQGENPDNVVFVANVQGLLSPANTANASFDENLMIEFNIDTNGDAVEDLVIQAVPKNKKMFFFGPFAPDQTGTVSTVEPKNFGGSSNVKITPFGSEAIVHTSDLGMKFFAGPRDDPFFFDFAQFTAILSGNAGSFNDPGMDTFAGTNVLSVVVEVPKSMIGGSGSVNTWVETKRKQ